MPKQSQAITPEHKRVLRVEDFEQMTLEERLAEIDKLEMMLFKLFCPHHKHPRELIDIL